MTKIRDTRTTDKKASSDVLFRIPLNISLKKVSP